MFSLRTCEYTSSKFTLASYAMVIASSINFICHQTVNQANVNDVVVHELLPVLSVELFEGIVLTVVKFLGTKFYRTDMI